MMGSMGGNPSVVLLSYSPHVYSSHQNFIGPMFQDKQGNLQKEVLLKVTGYLKIVNSQCVSFSMWMT